MLTLPSWNEGTPNVLLEARAVGRRVVATRSGGIPDVVNDGTLGEWVEARDPIALAAALDRVARSDYDAERISRTDCIDWNESAARLHDALTAAIEEHRQRR